MHSSYYEAESLEAVEEVAPEYGEVESFEGGAEGSVFGENEELELAGRLLEIADERELDRFLGALITRALGETHRLEPLPHLRAILRRAAVGEDEG